MCCYTYLKCVAIHTSKIYYFSNINAKPKGWWFFKPPPKLKIYVFLYILFPRNPACFKRWILWVLSSRQSQSCLNMSLSIEDKFHLLTLEWSLPLFFLQSLWLYCVSLKQVYGSTPKQWYFSVYSYVLYLFIGGQDLIHLFKMHINGFYFMFSERSKCSFAAVHSFAGASIGFIQVLLEEEMFG